MTITRDAALDKVGGLDFLYNGIAGGMSIREICEAANLPTTPQMQQSVRDLAKRHDPERMQQARESSADALAEKAGDVFGDTPPATSAHAKWVADKSGYFRWLSDLRSGRTERNNAGVTLNIQQLHLEALKAHGRPLAAERGPADAAKAFLAAGPVVDAEIVSDDG